MDEDDEDAPTIVDENDDDNADLQHGSLRAAFPMAFGELSCICCYTASTYVQACPKVSSQA